MILLVHPPVAKPCEPPAGVARLAGMLTLKAVEHRVLDANMEGLSHLLGLPLPAERANDRWTRRAFRNLQRSLSDMKNPDLYRSHDRYHRTVRDIGRVLSKVSPPKTAVGLANFEHGDLSPLRSGDLLMAAERPELDPFYPYYRMRLAEMFRERVPSVVGISLNYLSQALCTFSMAGYIRREFPKVKVILGGGLVTSWVRSRRLGNLFAGLVDELVAGPGESRIMSLLGLDENGVKIPRPSYGDLPRESYLSPGFILPYGASSGCYWNRCLFCPEHDEGNPYLAVPVQQVIEDLRTLAEETRPVLIHFLDNAISPALLEALAAAPIGIPWYGFARVAPHLADPAFCIALRKAGCVMLKLGIESGDQGVLDRMQKGTRAEVASAVLKNLRQAGIAAYVYLIFGTPEETEESARRTLAFTVRHRDCISFLNLAIFNMRVGGTLCEGLETRGFYEGDLSLYTDFTHPRGWDRKRVRRFLDHEFKRQPDVSAILRRDPPAFTSNHAPFFLRDFW